METTLPRAVGETEDADLLAGSLVFGHTEQVSELFAEHEKRPPLVVWSPTDDKFPNPEIRKFADCCLRMSEGAKCIQAAQFDVRQISEMSRWLMIVDVVNRGEDFIYTYYGEGIADHYRTNMTGRRTSEFGGFVSRFFIALYRAAMIRKEWVLSQHEPPPTVFVRCWDRLIVPIVDGLGDVVRFAVLNRAENELRAGLDALPCPCFVADSAFRLIYANAAASSALGNLLTCENRPYLPKFLGHSLEIGLTPEQLLATGRKMTVPVRVHRSRVPNVQRNVRAVQMSRATLGAVCFAGTPLYVVTLTTLAANHTN